jgi:hypothetical protein
VIGFSHPAPTQYQKNANHRQAMSSMAAPAAAPTNVDLEWQCKCAALRVGGLRDGCRVASARRPETIPVPSPRPPRPSLLTAFPSTAAASSAPPPPDASGAAPAAATVAGTVAPTLSPLGLFSPSFYKQLFDVDTDAVLQRLRLSLNPFAEAPFLSTGSPDLYGPVWISATLVFVIGACSNFASWYASSGVHIDEVRGGALTQGQGVSRRM